MIPAFVALLCCMSQTESAWSPAKVESRLIDFASKIIDYSQPGTSSFALKHLSQQLIRSSTSAALNYGESRAHESEKDLIHKLKLVLKELRECHVNLRITNRSNLGKKGENLDYLLGECNELVAMLVVTVKNREKSLR